MASRLCFGGFVLDVPNRLLLLDGVALPVEPKVYDCICILTDRAGQLVTTPELRAALWPSVHVGAGALRRVIAEVRKVLDRRADEPSLIHTRKKVGYVFVASVEPDLAPHAKSSRSAIRMN
jgi:DNA-binding winged helix-turn-helix (wHTH) protein